MGFFDNMKAAKDMMKNMSPEQMKDLMGQAQNYQKQMEEMIQKAVASEVAKRDLVSRDEVKKMLGK
jgi:BMFP domain-containing protein YqiC